MKISSRPFGILPDNSQVTLFTLSNKNGLKAEIIDYGAIIVSLMVPDKEGIFGDIVLGYDNIEDYLERSPFFGAIIGRHANRIEDAEFVIDNIKYVLDKNEDPNHLHGGIEGFDKRLWDSKIINNNGQESLELSLFSPDGDQGYPGDLEVRVIYRLNDFDELEIEYYAVSSKDTVLNLTNHSYFNLSGHNSGSIVNHEIKINADFYTPVNQETLPTGEIRNVKDTAFDFTESKTIKEALASYPNCEQLRFGSGYDHNFVIRNCDGNLMEGCQAYDPKSRRLMICYTTKPGVQLYTGNHLKSAGMGKNQAIYDDRHAFCLETQYFPNAMKYRHFPSPVLAAGNTYHHKTVYKFSTR